MSRRQVHTTNRLHRLHLLQRLCHSLALQATRYARGGLALLTSFKQGKRQRTTNAVNVVGETQEQHLEVLGNW